MKIDDFRNQGKDVATICGCATIVPDACAQRDYMCTNGSFTCAGGMQIMHAKRQAGKNQGAFFADFGEIETST